MVYGSDAGPASCCTPTGITPDMVGSRWMKIENFEESRPWVEKFSPAALLRKCTPAKAPLFLHTNGRRGDPAKRDADPTHSPVFSEKFSEIAVSRGIQSRWGTKDEFIEALAK